MPVTAPAYRNPARCAASVDEGSQSRSTSADAATSFWWTSCVTAMGSMREMALPQPTTAMDSNLMLRPSAAAAKTFKVLLSLACVK